MNTDLFIPTLIPTPRQSTVRTKPTLFQAITPNVRFKITKAGLYAKAEGESMAKVQINARTVHFWAHLDWVHVAFPSELGFGDYCGLQSNGRSKQNLTAPEADSLRALPPIREDSGKFRMDR